jgi:tetratricopeptide (TPR) repeat protein
MEMAHAPTDYSWDLPKETATEALADLDGPTLAAQLASERARAQEALEAAAESPDAGVRIAALHTLMDSAEHAGDLASASSASAEAVAAAQSANDSRLDAVTALLVGTVLLRAGELLDAIANLTLALESAEAANSPALVSLVLTQLAIGLGASGDRADALTKLDRAFAIGRAERLTLAKGHALATVACLQILDAPPPAGDGSEAPDLGMFNMLGRAQLLHERVGDISSLGRTYNNFGILHLIRGRFVSAIPFFERSLELLGGTNDVFALLAVLNNNIRAVEQYHLARAADLRDKMEELAVALHDQAIPRFADLTAWSANPIQAGSSSATFATDLYIADAMLLLPVLYGNHLGREQA